MNAAYNGAFNLTNEYNNETNSEALLQASKSYSHLALSGTFGGNMRKEVLNHGLRVDAGHRGARDLQRGERRDRAAEPRSRSSRRQVNSMYGSASFTYNGWWTVEGTARNDWSSTLPQGANSYFYPSVNTSVLLTDLLPALKSGPLSYAKLRGSIAKVGNDASPYQLRTVYNGFSAQFKGLPQFTLSNNIADATLKPELTKSSEIGLEVGFFNGRIDLDASYYDKETRNQIFPLNDLAEHRLPADDDQRRHAQERRRRGAPDGDSAAAGEWLRVDFVVQLRQEREPRRRAVSGRRRRCRSARRGA